MTETTTPDVGRGASITVDRLVKSFGDQRAVNEVSMDLPAGALLVLLGPSGCGKTTTLRMIAGLEDPSGGRIRFGDKTMADGDSGAAVPAEKRGIGMVFQSYALWPHMTVRANVEWPLKVAGWGTAERRRRSAEVLGMLGIDHLAERYPGQLSGGQQQRVAIARTVAPRPQVLLFDEPLSNLDARLRVDTRAELVEVHRRSGATSVYVTHDQIEALAMATHIAVLKEGRLEQFGTPDELLENPQTAFVAEFLGSPAAVLIEGTVASGELMHEGIALAAAVPLPDGETLSAMYRPEAISLAEQDGTGVDITVLESTPSAGRFVVTVRRGAKRIAVVSETRYPVGARLRLVLPEEPAALFDAEGRRWDHLA
ncbi:ABC transporter ATP-binding protein [Nesterenkonia muleiensis]|uniref:ABC transporter ATP-binding protein n=1 Tax=Nesterenkonia muleiensis TaxID=2282648 RepID=UPI000E715D60|nr:ABC transporter ATP-binding protein [Nesterenkonia muleiensis]